MPSIMRKRGRPKGHEVTVIGLPAKRSKGKQTCSDQKERVVAFIKLHSSVKERGSYFCHSSVSIIINFYDNYVAMLKWFVDIEVAKNVQRNKVLVEEEQVEVRPEFISDAVMDENVDVNLITLRTLLIAATNFSVLVAYCIWLVLILAIFE